MIDFLNQTRPYHIITIEDPIEYVHRHQMSIVDQREVGVDTPTFAEGLRAAFREDPDVLLIGEMRDLETISAALTVAETGHLVLATLHTNDAPQAVDRIVDSFSGAQQQQVRVQLGACLAGVIYQQLMPAQGGGRVAAFEILMANVAVRAMIKDRKTDQLRSVLQEVSARQDIEMDQHRSAMPAPTRSTRKRSALSRPRRPGGSSQR